MKEINENQIVEKYGKRAREILELIKKQREENQTFLDKLKVNYSNNK